MMQNVSATAKIDNQPIQDSPASGNQHMADLQALPFAPSEFDRLKAAQETAHETALETAMAFETAFIAQMLQFSGLAKALTVGGGEAVESFTQFYLEELAQDISNNGGFGLADKISTYINNKEEQHGELGRL